MIDAILRFSSLAVARADPVVVEHMDELRELFSADRIIPDLKVWRASQDVAGQHSYLSGYFVLISLDRVILSLRDHPAIQLVINRDKANAREAGAVLKRADAITQAVLQDIRFEPVFAGFDPPWGSMQE